MKKNMMMRLASVLLIAVLMSTCAISGTFAKYVTSDSANDSARVAKWGVTVTGTGEYFADAYETHDGVYTGAQSVITSGAAGDALVAPGTFKSDVATIVIGGKPEVATRVTMIGDVEIGDKWVVGTEFYCPIIVTIRDKAGNVKAEINGLTYSDADAFETAIETYINNFSQDYDPNVNLSAEDNSVISISWSWPFSTSAANDVKDTALGDAAAAGNAATISISVSCTVTQID